MDYAWLFACSFDCALRAPFNRLIFSSLSDMVILPDIYAARETDTLGVSSEKLANAIGEKARYMGDFAKIAEFLADEAKEGDLILTMGAGDVYKIANLLKEALEK